MRAKMSCKEDLCDCENVAGRGEWKVKKSSVVLLVGREMDRMTLPLCCIIHLSGSFFRCVVRRPGKETEGGGYLPFLGPGNFGSPGFLLDLARFSACLPHNSSFFEWQLWPFGPGIQNDRHIVWSSRWAVMEQCPIMPLLPAALASCCPIPGIEVDDSWHTLSYKKLNHRFIKYLICLMNECLQILMNSLLWLNKIEGWELSSQHLAKGKSGQLLSAQDLAPGNSSRPVESTCFMCHHWLSTF